MRSSRRHGEARPKQGMRGSCAWASQHGLKTFKITGKSMETNELQDHLKQQRGNDKEMREEEMNDLLKDAHEEEKAIRKKSQDQGKTICHDHWYTNTRQLEGKL